MLSFGYGRFIVTTCGHRRPKPHRPSQRRRRLVRRHLGGARRPNRRTRRRPKTIIDEDDDDDSIYDNSIRVFLLYINVHVTSHPCPFFFQTRVKNRRILKFSLDLDRLRLHFQPTMCGRGRSDLILHNLKWK